MLAACVCVVIDRRYHQEVSGSQVATFKRFGTRSARELCTVTRYIAISAYRLVSVEPILERLLDLLQNWQQFPGGSMHVCDLTHAARYCKAKRSAKEGVYNSQALLKIEELKVRGVRVLLVLTLSCGACRADQSHHVSRETRLHRHQHQLLLSVLRPLLLLLLLLLGLVATRAHATTSTATDLSPQSSPVRIRSPTCLLTTVMSVWPRVVAFVRVGIDVRVCA
jgi:hypothetical protein